MAEDKNILGDLAQGIGEDLQEKFTKGTDLKKVFSEQNLKKRRSSFWTCMIAGVLLVLLALGAAVYVNAIRVDTFENLMLEHVDAAALSTDELSIRSFARETIFYITGAQETWNPQIVIAGFPASGLIPQTFRDHMVTVRDGFGSAKTVLLAGVALVLVLLGRAVTDRKSGFSVGGYYLGAGVALAVAAGIGLWGFTNFGTLWSVLHKTLIPDGIFDAAEPVMKLFPVSVFAGYLPPVAKLFGILAGVIVVLPLILFPASKLLAHVPEKKTSGGGGTSSRRKTSTVWKTTTKSRKETKKSTAASRQTHSSR